MARPEYKNSFTAADEKINFNALAGYAEEQAESAGEAAIATAFATAHDSVLLKSSTESSTKVFAITVDDDGEITATEVVEPEPEA